MLRETRQFCLAAMLSLSTLGMVHAEQAVRSGDIAHLQLQYANEMRDLQLEMERTQQANRHVVKDPSVVALEVRKAQAEQQEKKTSAKKTAVNPRSAEVKAEVAALQKEITAKLPSINAALKQNRATSKMPSIELVPLKMDSVFQATAGTASPGKLKDQQAFAQAINKRLQEEMKKMDPQTRKQVEAVLKAAGEGKPIPLPSAVPPRQHSQLLQKGTP